MKEFNFDIHGVRSRIRSNDRDFLDFIRMNLSSYSSKIKDAEIESELEYIPYNPFKPVRKLVNIDDLKCLGHGIFVKPGEIYISERGLQIHFVIEEKIKIKARFQEDKLFFLMKMLMPGLTPKKHKYQSIMREILIYPTFWLLRGKGLSLLHASAVEKEGKASIFAGLAGAGKTTLATHMLLKRGYRLVSDNFLLFDENSIYPFIEMIRFPGKMVSSDKVKLQLLLNGRFYYSLIGDCIGKKCIPEKVFLLSLSNSSKIEEINNGLCSELVHSINDSTPEIQAYNRFAFILDQAGKNKGKGASIKNFLNRSKCFLLT
ncbi:hypothetical protein KY358_01925, partial [Candidatus Woesearchaeota archaeon]|nr:hypothetical protein [Candidatus Woesearchaeota archaeon]